jgi:hypothetical protein
LVGVEAGGEGGEHTGTGRWHSSERTRGV